MDGVLILDKPRGISSHGAVQKLRKLTGVQRIGHLGTLDPIGTGVLPMVVGRATRLAQFFLNHDRAYEAVIRFGFATDTYDATGQPATEPSDVSVTAEQIEAVLPQFRGKLTQTPPPVSAKKVGGVPAYKLARKKQPVQLEPVEVEIHEFRLIEAEESRARVYVRCSAGGYMRALAHDLGHKLGVGGHIEELRRVAMGEFTIDMARTLEELERLREQNRLEEALAPLDLVLPEIPTERVDEVTATQIAHGRDFRVSAFGNRRGAKRIKAVDPTGRLVAIAEARLPLVYHPIVVL